MRSYGSRLLKASAKLRRSLRVVITTALARSTLAPISSKTDTGEEGTT